MWAVVAGIILFEVVGADLCVLQLIIKIAGPPCLRAA